MDVIGTKRIDSKHGNQGAVDTAGQSQNDVGEFVFDNVILQATPNGAVLRDKRLQAVVSM